MVPGVYRSSTRRPESKETNEGNQTKEGTVFYSSYHLFKLTSFSFQLTRKERKKVKRDCGILAKYNKQLDLNCQYKLGKVPLSLIALPYFFVSRLQ